MRVEYLEPKLCLIKPTTCLAYVVVSVMSCWKQNLGHCAEIPRLFKLLQCRGKRQDHGGFWLLKAASMCVYTELLAD